MFFSHILCFNSNYVDKQASFHAVAMATAGIIVREPVSRKMPSGEGVVSPALLLLAARVGPSTTNSSRKFARGHLPTLHHPRGMGTWKHCCCEVFCWLAQREQDFPGHELESVRAKEDLCTSPHLPGDVISTAAVTPAL